MDFSCAKTVLKAELTIYGFSLNEVKNYSVFQTFKVWSSETEAINFPDLGAKITLEISELWPLKVAKC